MLNIINEERLVVFQQKKQEDYSNFMRSGDDRKNKFYAKASHYAATYAYYHLLLNAFSKDIFSSILFVRGISFKRS